MGQYPKILRGKWWGLLVLEFCLVNHVASQTLPQVDSNKSETIAQRISIRTVRISQESRIPACAPWTINSTLAGLQAKKSFGLFNRRLGSRPSPQTLGNVSEIEPLARFQSLSDNSWPVPDPTIAVGDTHIIVVVNSKFAIYDKSGDNLFSTTLEAWFEQTLPLSDYDCGPFSPRLLYDGHSKRWFLAALANATPPIATSYILFAASENSNALGDWYVWVLNASQDGKNTTKFLASDLALGLGANTIFLSTNQYDDKQFKYAKVRLLDVNEIAKGESLNWWDLWDFRDHDSELSFSVIPALSFNANDTLTYFVNTNRIASENISLWPVIPRFPNAPGFDGFSISLAPGYTRPEPAPQRGVLARLHAGDARVQSATLRGDTLWLTFTTGGVDLTPLGGHVQVVGLKRGAVIFNQTEAFDDVWNFMPSLSVDGNGNLATVHYHTSKNDTPSLRIFLSSSNPQSSFPEKQARLWQSPQPLASLQSDTALWGQRTSIALDPTDQVTFWGVGELVDDRNNEKWITAVGAASLFLPDLAFEGNCDTIEVYRGEPKRISLNVSNADRAFAARTRLTVFFSLDADLSAGDTVIGDTTVDFINAASRRVVNFDLAIGASPRDSVGFLFFVLDYQNALPESNEKNNVWVCPVVIRVYPLECSVSFRHPSDGASLCVINVCTQLVPKVTGGVPPYKVIACSVNGVAGQCTDSLVTACVKLVDGENILNAKIIVEDEFDSLATCNTSIKVNADFSAPKVDLKFVPVFPYIRGTICDLESGIVSITVLMLQNATFQYDSSALGTKKVAFSIDPVNASKPVAFLIATTNSAGCSTQFDPFFVRLEAESPRSTIMLQVPPQEHFFNLENHGLTEITLNANEKRYAFVASAEKHGKEGNTFYIPLQGNWTVDMAELWNNDDLEVILTADGKTGQYAYAIFSDQPWDFTNPLEETPDARAIPQRFALWPSYPNPFNPSTTIHFDVAANNQHPVSLKIYNLNGQLVATLLDGFVAPGEYDLIWHGRDNQNNLVSTGVYFYVFQTPEYRMTRKMTLVR